MSKEYSRVLTSDLEGYLRQGFHNFDLTVARIISSNAVQNTTEAGVPDGNTAPSLARVNGATDKQLRLAWAAAAENEIQFAPWELPPDLDPTAPITIRLRCGKDANANTVTIDAQVFFNTGDTECGAATGTIAQATAYYDVTVAAADVPDAGGVLNVALVPSAHAGDALYLYSACAIYTRRA